MTGGHSRRWPRNGQSEPGSAPGGDRAGSRKSLFGAGIRESCLPGFSGMRAEVVKAREQGGGRAVRAERAGWGLWARQGRLRRLRQRCSLSGRRLYAVAAFPAGGYAAARGGGQDMVGQHALRYGSCAGGDCRPRRSSAAGQARARGGPAPFSFAPADRRQSHPRMELPEPRPARWRVAGVGTATVRAGGSGPMPSGGGARPGSDLTRMTWMEFRTC